MNGLKSLHFLYFTFPNYNAIPEQNSIFHCESVQEFKLISSASHPPSCGNAKPFLHIESFGGDEENELDPG